MKEYEEKKYASWRENLESTLMSYLKRNLLVRVSTTAASARAHVMGEEERPAFEETEGTASLTTLGQGICTFSLIFSELCNACFTTKYAR